VEGVRGEAMRAGETVLVKGASGGVGSAAVQLAVAAGARVTAVAGPSSQEHCRTLGATTVHDYTRTDPAELPERFDVVLDCIGASPLRRYRRILAPGGRLVSIAPSPSTLALSVLTRVLPGPAVRTLFVTPSRSDLDELAARVDAGALRMPVQETFPLERVADAHRALAERHGRGKRVLLVGVAVQDTGDDTVTPGPERAA
jgi:NADPH:quinone reductase-like Zn-dependent oxidoreductase